MLVAILSAGTISCSTVTYIPAATQFYAIDFSKYTELGFLITPEKFIGEYESIGIVAVVRPIIFTPTSCECRGAKQNRAAQLTSYKISGRECPAK